MIDLNEIRFFVHVARTRNFTAAAKRLEVSKSKISRGIARLERRLGVRLLERTTRRVALTSDGEMYLQYCTAALENAQRAEFAVGALRANPQGRLRVGSSIVFLQCFLALDLGDFLRRYPQVDVHLQPLGGRPTPMDGILDVLIEAGRIHDFGSSVKKMGSCRFAIYASPIYVEKHGLPDTPADLRDHACITRGEGAGGVVWRLHCGSETAAVRLESRVSVADPVAQWRFAQSGVGIAVISQSLARADEKEGRLIRLLPDWEPESLEVSAVYPAGLDQVPKLRVFLEWLDDRLGHQSTHSRALQIPLGPALALGQPSSDSGPNWE